MHHLLEEENIAQVKCRNTKLSCLDIPIYSDNKVQSFKSNLLSDNNNYGFINKLTSDILNDKGDNVSVGIIKIYHTTFYVIIEWL